MSAAMILAIVLVTMAAEALLSARHERELRARGAIEPAQDVYATMRWAYPAGFLLMALEGAIVGPPPREVSASGVAVFLMAKALKAWAIQALGVRWTFRVLVLPGVPLVTRGPYALMRHPNYVAVVGELVGAALMFGSPVTGPVGLIAFGSLLRRRIAVEERALKAQ